VTLDSRDRKRLETVERFIEENGYAPTFRQIQEMNGWRSVDSAHNWASRMRRAGYLDWHGLSPRTMRFTEEGRAALKVQRWAA
jgi:SOS-response transcriptional repressor LexA